MKRSLQEYVELVVFGLIALLVGTGLLWLLGWVLSLGGIVLKGLAGLLWMLLRFIVPVAIAGGLVYFLVKAAQDRQKPATTAGGSTPAPAGGAVAVGSPTTVPVVEGVASDVTTSAQAVAEDAADAATDVATAATDAVADAAAEADDTAGAAADDLAAAAEAAVDDLLAEQEDEDEEQA